MDEFESKYNKLVQREGVKTTICANRFEIMAKEGTEVWEQHSVQLLREWVRWRKKKEELHGAGDLPG